MSTLHIVNKSPFRHRCLDDCLRVSGKGDALLLIEDGVFTLQSAAARSALEGMAVFALAPDLEARGIRGAEGISLLDYEGFVDLAIEHDKSLTWG